MKIGDIKLLDRIIADSGFTCIPKGAVRSVQQDDKGKYVHCSNGKHYLDGQENERGEIVGFRPQSISA